MSSGVEFNINVGGGNSNATISALINGLTGITTHLNTLNQNFIGFSQKNIAALQNLQAPVTKVGTGLSDCTNKVLLLTQAAQGLQNLQQVLNNAVQPGIKLNSSMADLSAITGVTGSKLNEIEAAARKTAKAFGTDAAQNAESYKLILSQLSPEIANNSTALKAMGENVNILSKSMGGNTVAATEVLTTAMNQYGVSTKDPIEASKKMAEMMNIMAAGAKEGSAELPQIKSALEQSGMMAKTAGVQFSELNGAIQVLDKAGKKGAEGGVAIRNMLAEMSQGAMNSPKTIKMLESAGINIDKLADKSLTFSERLRLLKPIASDTASMTQLFGKENVAAAIALANQTDELDRYTGVIQGTNTAVEQANVVMGSYQEKMNRITAKFNDYKISLFNATQAFLPHLQVAMGFVVTTGQMASGIQSIITLTGKLIPKKIEDAGATTGQGVATGFLGRMLGMVRNGMVQATLATAGFSLALYNIPVIGWIAAAIAAVIAVIKILWDNCKGFREVLFGIWEAAKAVFHNIGLVISRVWELVIKPVAMFIFNIFKTVFMGIWNTIKTVFSAVAGVFKWLWDTAVEVWNGIWGTISGVISWIWDGIVSVGTAIGDFFSGIWKWITDLFSGITSFINKWLIQPIKDAFNWVWDIISGVFNKIWDGIKKIFGPIIKLWNKIFSGDGMKDITVAYKEGEKKGGESYDKDHPVETKETPKTPAEQVIEQKGLATLLEGTGNNAAKKATKKNGNEGSSITGAGKANNITLIIQKLTGIDTLHTTNLQTSAKEAGRQIVEEILMALNSVNGKASAI